jgi:hypothetical protein
LNFSIFLFKDPLVLDVVEFFFREVFLLADSITVETSAASAFRDLGLSFLVPVIQ